MESRDINLEVVKKKNQKPKQNILDNYWCVQYGYMSLTYIDVHRRGFFNLSLHYLKNMNISWVLLMKYGDSDQTSQS